ncbi:MAG: L-aspartate oxidase [Bacteroidetes bacterium]|nr:L-aspartate oxidase [Bacteroidota bacterium]
MHNRTDILVIGSGASGLFFALKTAQKRPDLKILIMTKSNADESNTRFAQGGIAVVTDNNKISFDKHIEDTINAGGGLCKKNVVEMVVHQAPDRLKELLEFNVEFDKKSSGDWDLGLEGGHTQHRILHHKDISGSEILKKLLIQLQRMPNITLVEEHIIFDLIIHNSRCIGAYYYHNESKKIESIQARMTLLCTGGSGQIFKHTTNPVIATGDGVAIAHRAGAEIKEIKYVQFHPTALFEKDKNPYFLISEAVRGFGAYIVNNKNERFLFETDSRGELATRDIVSRAIGAEMEKQHCEYVFIDCRHLDYEKFYQHFPTITDYCRSIGIDIRKDLIPIVPVAHYQCGGIKVDMDSQTSIPNLFAVGECSRTGLHGNNRLASNSLLEALVYAHQSSEYICDKIDSVSFLDPNESEGIFSNYQYNITLNYSEELRNFKALMQETMTALFIKNTNPVEAKSVIEEILSKITPLFQKDTISLQLKELQNMLAVAELMVKEFLENNIKARAQQ